MRPVHARAIPTLLFMLMFCIGGQVAMEAMLSGSPLLFLDLRDRTLFGKVPDRATLLARAKEEYVKHCDAMLEQNVAECLDACSISYFHEVRGPGLRPGPACHHPHSSRRGRHSLAMAT